MRVQTTLRVVLGVLGAMFFAASASADQTTVTLGIKGDEYNGSIGSAPFGSVSLNLNASGDIAFTITPNSHLNVGKEGSANIFGFNYTGTDALSVSSLPSGLSLGTNGVIDVFGTFDYVISSSNGTLYDPLTFTVHRSGGFTTVNQLVDLSVSPTSPYPRVDFAAQVINCYGYVAGLAPVPEPATFGMMGIGALLLTVYGIRRRRRV